MSAVRPQRQAWQTTAERSHPGLWSESFGLPGGHWQTFSEASQKTKEPRRLD